MVESLDKQTFSPSVFGKVVSPEADGLGTPQGAGLDRKGRAFWSIDHIANLYPAQIDEEPSEEQSLSEEHGADPLMEQRIQSAIERFWAKHPTVAPSPLDSPAWRSRLCHAISDSIGSSAKKSPSHRPALLQNKSTPSGRARTASQRTSSPLPPNGKWTQTLLTFPPEIDIVSQLGSQFLFDEAAEAEPCPSADVSINALRRKLFAQQGEDEDDGLFKDVQPEMEQGEEDDENEWGSGAESPPLFFHPDQPGAKKGGEHTVLSRIFSHLAISLF